MVVYIFSFIIKMVDYFRNLIPHLKGVRLEMTYILHQADPNIQFLLISYPLITGRKLNVDNTYKSRRRGLLYVLRTFSLYPVSKG